MNENILIVTVGLPRSGKSTWALKQGHPIVSADAIRLALTGFPFLKEAEDMVHSIEMYMVKSLFLAGHKTVIVDATHMKEQYRARWLCSKYQELQWNTMFQHFHTDKKTCIKRAIADDKEVLIPIINAMAKPDYDKERNERCGDEHSET